MKKLFLSFAIVVMATLGANAQVSFGAQFGGNLATLESEYTSGGTTSKEKGKIRFGFLAGAVVNIPFSSSLSFRPELNFIQKGGKYSSSETIYGYTNASTENVSLNFIELPLNIVFGLPAGPGRFSVGAGPNISFGLSGKDKYTQTSSGPGIPTQTTSDEINIKFDGKKDADLPPSNQDLHLKRVDFGANAFVGYKLNMGLFFNAGYTLGFSNLNPNPNASLKTAGLTFKVGYLFGGNSSNDE